MVSDDAVSVSVDDIQADTESQETVDFTPKQEPVQQVESLEMRRMLPGRRNTISTITSGKWKKAVPRPDTSGIWMQSAL